MGSEDQVYVWMGSYANAADAELDYIGVKSEALQDCLRSASTGWLVEPTRSKLTKQYSYTDLNRGGQQR